ncbi:hypothetical protein GWK47_015526 [Chionoecetes opilio]|uniref:Uncharacterized protein n=1 Tax=Chionoecetes opilio TaxID=41210 RepID=A0A8J4XTB1_CHIOP|nr:hypothetical protein GWK47_015526 [Chionoecetes opilio]
MEDYEESVPNPDENPSSGWSSVSNGAFLQLDKLTRISSVELSCLPVAMARALGQKRTVYLVKVPTERTWGKPNPQTRGQAPLSVPEPSFGTEAREEPRGGPKGGPLGKKSNFEAGRRPQVARKRLFRRFPCVAFFESRTKFGFKTPTEEEDRPFPCCPFSALGGRAPRFPWVLETLSLAEKKKKVKGKVGAQRIAGGGSGGKIGALSCPVRWFGGILPRAVFPNPVPVPGGNPVLPGRCGPAPKNQKGETFSTMGPTDPPQRRHYQAHAGRRAKVRPQQ